MIAVGIFIYKLKSMFLSIYLSSFYHLSAYPTLMKGLNYVNNMSTF